MERKSLNLVVPAGIGDVSWILSKIVNVKDDFDFNIQVCDGWPHRTVPFLKMFPWIREVAYSADSYPDIVDFQSRHKLTTWERVANCGFGRILLAPNPHLEQGRRLEDWLPDLPTDFHYVIPTGFESEVKADKILKDVDTKYVYGISAASYRGSEAWKTWGHEEWSRFLTRWLSIKPSVKFIFMGGFWDDLTHSIYEEFEVNSIDAVGKTDFGAAVEIHKRIKGYVGFSSGLGIIRTVLGLKTFMLWPDHQIELSTSWAPPEMLEDQTYMASLWRDPDEVFYRFKGWLRL
jgi:hypothetical protein